VSGVPRALGAVAGVKVAALGLYLVAGRRQQLRWGATAAEVDAALPGDVLLPAPALVATRAITIRAGAGEVWPWLAQLGQARGGFYSYDWLENLAGCQIRSAERIVDEWQHVEVGDELRLHPQVPLRVAVVEPPHALVVQGGPAEAAQPPADGAPYDFTWAFVLVEVGPGTTRLVVRERYRYRARWVPLLVEPLALVSFVMSERMLRGIRDRAQGSRPAPRVDAPPPDPAYP
jgi:hypothetical protein